MSPSLCVVIPHRRRRDLLAQALAAVDGWPTLIVDDGDEPLPAQAGAERLRLGGGQGFAKAANLGLAGAQARGHDWVLLLNDDAAPEPGCVEALLGALDAGVGAVGPLLIGPRGLESAGIDFNGITGRLKQRTAVPSGTATVDALSGACLLLRSAERFDEAFGHGMEDVALALDLRRRGLRCLLVPEARCRHLGGATVSRTSRAAQAHAVAGHLRLVGRSRLRRALVLSYALAQVLREGGPAERVAGVWEGWRR
ncbi:MAG: glycosyltransferase family 2 protein [Alphaproteobacteria bacterium]|nr:glycosyltransferase family 2 protein [Alphaproteobacteria bacterium]MCB9791300.1 glycosyltransferase family 2 protein [Alphaproteobacteria bacterium]